MQLITYRHGELSTATIGLLHAQSVFNLPRSARALGLQPIPDDMIELLELGTEGAAKVHTAVLQADSRLSSIAVSQITFLQPVLKPRMVVALGRNYAAHAAEGNAEVPEWPMLFHKTSTSLIGHNQPIRIPPITQCVDYEGELAVIIGKRCYQADEKNALGFVAGYSVANDVSARDLQRRTSQFAAGKMLDTFGPLGPAIVTPDEVGDADHLTIQTRLNGVLMQDDTTANMIFNLPYTIAYISQICTLHPGDVILTGTPQGVGYARNPPVFLKAGDRIEIEIERVGLLSNTVENCRPAA